MNVPLADACGGQAGSEGEAEEQRGNEPHAKEDAAGGADALLADCGLVSSEGEAEAPAVLGGDWTGAARGSAAPI